MLGLNKILQNKTSRYPRTERIQSLTVGLIIPVIVTFLGGYFLFRTIQINYAQRLIRECEGKKYCQGRISALEKLVITKTNLQSYNLDGANLNGANLNGANLHGTKLYDANLHHANLIGANLHGTRLFGANLYGAHLEFAHLDSAYMNETNLDGANLEFANLNGANLIGAHFDGTSLTGANLEFTYLIKSENLLPSQLKSACYWDKAFYKGHWDSESWQWIVDHHANQLYIEKLKLDQDSDPKQPVDCSMWNQHS